MTQIGAFFGIILGMFVLSVPVNAGDVRLDEQLAKKIEAQVVMPARTDRPLSEYVRYYRQGTGNENNFVFAVFAIEEGQSGIRSGLTAAAASFP